MAPNIALNTAYLNALVAAALFYGIYFSLFCGSVYVLCLKRRSGRINYTILTGTTLQFILITVYLGFEWDRCYTAFITHGNIPGGALMFFFAANGWQDVTASCLAGAASQLGEFMFVYRVYVVWDMQVIPTLVPFVLCVASLVSNIAVQVELSKPITTTYVTRLSHWVIAFLSLNLAQNMASTLIITARIWHVYIQASRFASVTGLWSVMLILLESGALYSSTVLVFLVTYVCKNNGAIIIAEMLIPIMGITFNLIIVRAGLGLSKVATATRSNTGWRSKGQLNTILQFVRPTATTTQSLSLDGLGDMSESSSPQEIKDIVQATESLKKDSEKV